MAGNPLAAMALIGIGYRSLSMSAAAIGPVKAMTLALDAGKLAAELDRCLDAGDGSADLRGWLSDFADAESVPY
jgi:phosphotransferase system enzyme I (PtsP)